MEPETIALARKMEAASETQYSSERPDGVWVLWDERGDFDHRMAPAACRRHRLSPRPGRGRRRPSRPLGRRSAGGDGDAVTRPAVVLQMAAAGRRAGTNDSPRPSGVNTDDNNNNHEGP